MLGLEFLFLFFAGAGRAAAVGHPCCIWVYSSCSDGRLVSSSGPQVSHCGGFSWGLRTLRREGFSSCGFWDLGSWGTQ